MRESDGRRPALLPPVTPPPCSQLTRRSEQVARRLSRADPSRSHRTPAEIGAGVWVDTVVHDASVVTLDLGLDVHMSLPVAEAAAYATKRAEVLRKKRAALVLREERLSWEVEQVR